MECDHHHEGNNADCIGHVPIFSSLTHEERQEIFGVASSRRFEKGSTVYRAGDDGGTLFVLYTGKVKLYRLTMDGREQVLRVVAPGEFFGELSLFSSLPLTDYAQALEDSTMCVLHGTKLKGLIAKYPSIAFKVMDVLSRRLEEAEGRIETISLNSVTQRLARRLLELSGGKREFVLPMAKGDLSSQLGMSQETLSRKLAQLQEEGLIGLEGQRKIIILDRPGLEEASHGE